MAVILLLAGLALAVSACDRPRAPSVEAQAPKRFVRLVDDWPVDLYCDTENGNLIYIAGRYDAVAMSVVPGGCKP
jgi:hypothetical protein